jgi:hypothetical protein
MRYAYRILVVKPKGRNYSRKPKRRFEDKIKMDLKEVVCEGVDRFKLASVLTRLRRKADHSSPPNTEVMNTWNYTFTPPIRLHGMVIG